MRNTMERSLGAIQNILVSGLSSHPSGASVVLRSHSYPTTLPASSHLATPILSVSPSGTHATLPQLPTQSPSPLNGSISESTYPTTSVTQTSSALSSIANHSSLEIQSPSLVIHSALQPVDLSHPDSSSAETRAFTLSNGTVIHFSVSELRPPPAISFSHDLPLLFKHWYDSDSITLGGHGIPIGQWDRLYKKKMGVPHLEKAWDKFRSTWGNWKVRSLLSL